MPLLFVLLVLLSNALAEHSESENKILKQLEAQTLAIRDIVERQQNHLSITQREQATLQTLSTELEAVKSKLQNPDTSLVEKATFTLEKVNSNQQTLSQLQEKIQNQESLLGSLSGTLKTYPTGQAQNTQAVTDLKKATEEYAKELHALKEQVGEFISKGVKGVETNVDTLKSKVESSKLTIDNILKKVETESSASKLETVIANQGKILAKLQEDHFQYHWHPNNFPDTPHPPSTQASESSRKFDKVIENQNKILARLDETLWNSFLQWLNKAAEATVKFVNYLKKTIEKDVLPKIQKTLTPYLKKIPSTEEVLLAVEQNLFNPLLPILKQKNVPTQYHQYIFGVVLGGATLIVGLLTYLIVSFVICKPIRYLCCAKKKQVKKEEGKAEEGEATETPPQKSSKQNKRKGNKN